MSELYIKFGELLKLERERQGVTLSDVSNALKIAESALQNIEDGDANALPEELYFKMFSRSYAEHLGIDYARTIEAMREELGESLEQDFKEDNPRAAKRRTGRRTEPESDEDKPTEGLRGNMRHLIILAGVVVGTFVIFLVVWQLFSGGDDSTGEDSAETSASGETSQGSDSEPIASANETYDWNVPAYSPPDSIKLTLVARQASWATVLADGDTALYQTLNPGRQYTRTAKYRFLISVGVPRVVDISIDDRPAFLAATPGGRISRVEVDQTNRGSFGTPIEAVTATSAPTNRVETTELNRESNQSGDSDSI